MQEDHLRLLRALRFLACYPNLSMPKTDQLALSQHVHLLPVLSAERIAGELKRLWLELLLCLSCAKLDNGR